MTKFYRPKDYTIKVGRVNWAIYNPSKVPDSIRYLYYIEADELYYFLFTKTEEDANYLRVKHPEWFI